MDITFINQSHAITDQKVAQIAEACGLQLKNDVAAEWDIQHPIGVKTGSAPTSRAIPSSSSTRFPRRPAHLHTTSCRTTESPRARSGCKRRTDRARVGRDGRESRSCRTPVRHLLTSWSFSNRLSCLVATEACDPVQGDSYTVDIADGTKVPVSNFVTPAYFTDNALGNKVDYLGKLNETFAISPGGYQIQMKGGAVKQAWGTQSAGRATGRQGPQSGSHLLARGNDGDRHAIRVNPQATTPRPSPSKIAYAPRRSSASHRRLTIYTEGPRNRATTRPTSCAAPSSRSLSHARYSRTCSPPRSSSPCGRAAASETLATARTSHAQH